MRLTVKWFYLDWWFIAGVAFLSGIGIILLYAAGHGHWYPWASRQLCYVVIGFFLMFCIAFLDVQFLFRYAYILYFLFLLALLGVFFFGIVGLGARRWINLGFFHFQPSEMMRIVLILGLARYFHGISYENIRYIKFLLIPATMILIPFVLVLKQPDLGTALMILIGGGILCFLAGVRLWVFLFVLGGFLIMIPVVWHHMPSYQKTRILTFFNPSQDSAGAGYHILQSEIAIGSGGIFGKGFMHSTQGNLDFLPEKQTDFIFSFFAEQYGFLGGIVICLLYGFLIIRGFGMANQCNSYFTRLLATGSIIAFGLYVITNLSMVVGFIPVVGVPLPLLSYGGTVTLTVMTIFGILLNAAIHQDARFQGR